MNGDIQAARKLLSDLREAYQGLPAHLQLRITCLLRENASLNNTESRTNVRSAPSRAEQGVNAL